jgi:hypothetical protein
VTAYWRKPPIRLPRCFSPVGWMPEKMRMGRPFARGRGSKELALSAARVCLASSAQLRQNRLRRWSEDIVLLF